MTTQRVILNAAIERSVVRLAFRGDWRAREFRGWLELTTALEAMLDRGADPARNVTTEQE